MQLAAVPTVKMRYQSVSGLLLRSRSRTAVQYLALKSLFRLFLQSFVKSNRIFLRRRGPHLAHPEEEFLKEEENWSILNLLK